MEFPSLERQNRLHAFQDWTIPFRRRWRVQNQFIQFQLWTFSFRAQIHQDVKGILVKSVLYLYLGNTKKNPKESDKRKQLWFWGWKSWESLKKRNFRKKNEKGSKSLTVNSATATEQQRQQQREIVLFMDLLFWSIRFFWTLNTVNWTIELFL